MGTVSDAEDYGDLFVSRNVKVKIECFSTPAFIKVDFKTVLVCVRYKTQTKVALFIHCAALGRFNGGCCNFKCYQ